MLIALLLQVAVPGATASADAFAERAWGMFQRSGALSRQRDRVDIVTDGRDDRSGPLHYKLRLMTSGPGGPDTLWTNSRTCPAVRSVIGSLRDLQPPRPMPPGFDDCDIVILTDGTGYEISVPVTDRVNASRITWRSNIGTPLSAWVDKSLLALIPCWLPIEPRLRQP